VRLTAVNAGYYVVSVNGVDVSKHTTEREAVEAAVAREAMNPSDVVFYRHDYVVKVESANVVSVALTGVSAGVES
jgi:hypothetical protein